MQYGLFFDVGEEEGVAFLFSRQTSRMSLVRSFENFSAQAQQRRF